jgi:hypothetical protein
VEVSQTNEGLNIKLFPIRWGGKTQPHLK